MTEILREGSWAEVVVSLRKRLRGGEYGPPRSWSGRCQLAEGAGCSGPAAF